ncbi:Hypothetical predicted protein [Pelobates cultripes]|uniref:Uncharacterized protein n=1 Tax=Pelobates cultripes TaxID=61616 RepID=A0AAD1R186_PELCU|nr:Hypothetical predicted protein [Pelobates cultripes]
MPLKHSYLQHGVNQMYQCSRNGWNVWKRSTAWKALQLMYGVKPNDALYSGLPCLPASPTEKETLCHLHTQTRLPSHQRRTPTLPKTVDPPKITRQSDGTTNWCEFLPWAQDQCLRETHWITIRAG